MAKPSENLINLCRAAVEAHQTVTAQPYTPEGWRPWMDAAETFQAAVTAEAEATGEGRYALEQAAKKAVLHPEPDGE
ncbi:hypothetical protein ACH43Y_13715 [Streptomyces rubiginosohelvolus]|uniref:hypothetical protein n=1 Tax=Streptomyces rubiginosohelvolus TaxID=67362 RepID=UPI0037A5A5FA